MSSVQAQIQNYDKLKSTIAKIKEQSARAERSAVKDMKSRAPGWIASAVTEQYNIKKSEITPASKSSKKPQKKAGSISISGDTIETLTFTYQGRRLTPTHFGMTPKKPAGRLKVKSLTPGGAFQVTRKGGSDVVFASQPKPYQITMEVHKGQRKTLSGKYAPAPFLAPANKGSSTIIPFQRTGGDGKYAVEAIKTTSVPQMVQNEVVAEVFLARINEVLEDRLQHHLKRQGL